MVKAITLVPVVNHIRHRELGLRGSKVLKASRFGAFLAAVAMAREVGADIYFGDAAHMRSDHHAGRTWGKKGETPIVEATGARHGMSLISAITSRGHMRFMLVEKGGVNADVFIEFLKRPIVGAEQTIFLI